MDDSDYARQDSNNTNLLAHFLDPLNGALQNPMQLTPLCKN
jgi:hypothetical protein